MIYKDFRRKYPLLSSFDLLLDCLLGTVVFIMALWQMTHGDWLEAGVLLCAAYIIEIVVSRKASEIRHGRE